MSDRINSLTLITTQTRRGMLPIVDHVHCEGKEEEKLNYALSYTVEEEQHVEGENEEWSDLRLEHGAASIKNMIFTSEMSGAIYD